VLLREGVNLKSVISGQYADPLLLEEV
jgi:hypothetical protein